MTIRYDAQARYERFAQLRAAYPHVDFEEIMQRIYDEEDDAWETAQYEALDAAL